MKDITINFKNKTIEMSKSFAKAASEYGSVEYNNLIGARNDFPTFRLVTKIERKKSAKSTKRFTYDYMFKYITAHDADGKIMAEFRTLRAVDKSGNRIKEVEPADYKDVLEWFFNTYPEIKKLQDKIEKILKNTNSESQESNSSPEDEAVQNNYDAE